MSMEERLEQAEKLVAEVKAELAAMRVTKRNWPERIEAGDCFEVTSGARWMKTDTDGILVCIRDEHGKMDAAGVTIKVKHYDDMTYLGHARDILTIRTDAHEPTGAELVGRRVNCFDMLDQLQFEGVCDEYDPDATCSYRIGKAWYFKARLAK